MAHCLRPGVGASKPTLACDGAELLCLATTAANLTGAAAFAYAAKIYSARSEVDLRAYGNVLATRAKRAWDWVSANPHVLYYNNDDTK
jgi:hypothetical protein